MRRTWWRLCLRKRPSQCGVGAAGDGVRGAYAGFRSRLIDHRFKAGLRQEFAIKAVNQRNLAGVSTPVGADVFTSV